MFYNTPFVNPGVGSIYVNEYLYDKYIVANGWSSLSSLIVSVPGSLLLSYSDGLVYGATKTLYSNYTSVLSISKADVTEFSLSQCSSFPRYTYSNISPFYGCTNLESVNLPSLTSTYISMFSTLQKLKYVELLNCSYISDYTFYSCTSLSEVSLPVCSYVGGNAFWSCTSLTEVDLPSCSYISNYAFQNCSSLSEVNLPVCSYVGIGAFGKTGLLKVNLPTCKGMNSGVFMSCLSLSEVNLPVCESVDTNTFAFCSSLKKVSLPSCSYISVYAFNQCISLTSVNLPVCSYVGSSAFQNCSSLSMIDLPVCSYIANSAFYGCISLKSISLPNCEYISNQAFQNCSSLSMIDLPVCSFIGTQVFYNCGSLTVMILRSTSVVTGSPNGMFPNTVQSIYVPESLIEDYKVAQYWSSVSTKFQPILPNLSFSDGLVYGWAESLNSTYLETLSISANDVTAVSMSLLTDLASSTFKNHQNLTQYDIPQVSYYNDETFAGCTSLSDTYISVPLGNSVFAGCTGISDVIINTSSLGNEVFAGCTSLEKVHIYYEYSVVTAGNDIFSGCTSLMSIEVPDGMVSVYQYASGWSQYSSLIYEKPLPELSFSNGLVYGSTSTISSGYTSTIGITNVNNVISVSLPNCTTIGSSTFIEHHNLVNLKLPSVERIETQGFYGANALSVISLPNCSYIGKSAFNWCGTTGGNGLTMTLAFSGVVTLQDNGVFNSTQVKSIYVPVSLVDTYKSAQYWSTYSNKIFPIE